MTQQESVVTTDATVEPVQALSSSELEDQIEKTSKRKNPFQILKQWGPLKRWGLYRQSRHHAGHYGNRDAEDNAKGRLPEDEGVQIPGLWVAELYTPSTVSGLLQGIENLDWEYGRFTETSLTKWMNDVRQGRFAGQVNLGLVSSPQASHFMRERSASLPNGVSAVMPMLMSITPSITAFVVLFMFEDNTAGSLETCLRANFNTTTRSKSLNAWHLIRYIFFNRESVRFRYSIFNPDLLRREALKSQIEKLENECTQWMGKHFPGAIHSLPNTHCPTALLLLTEQVIPLTEEASKIKAFEGIGLNRDYDAWESSEWPGARLAMPRWDEDKSRLTFACRRQDAFPESLGYHDPTSNWTIAYRANDVIPGLLSRWAISCLLDAYHAKLSAMRDEIACDGSYRTVRDLKKLRFFARTLLYDIGACTPEVKEFAQSEYRYEYDVIKMTYAQSESKKHVLSKSLGSSQIKRAGQVKREAELLRTTLGASNELSQTITNIRIQQLMVLLTIISIGIAMWAGVHAS